MDGVEKGAYLALLVLNILDCKGFPKTNALAFCLVDTSWSVLKSYRLCQFMSQCNKLMRLAPLLNQALV